jgi:GT2 family glycosyltransferase
MTDLTVIIVTWNCKNYIEECLSSLFSNPVNCRMEVVVVDNHSSDGTVEMIRSGYPHVNIIANMENNGFAAANNQAIRKTQSRYILLLNPDTIVHGRAIDQMVAYMDAHSETGGLGPAIVNGDGSPQRTGITFPNAWNLFVEAVFLDRAFPTSRIFGRHKGLFNDFTFPFEVDYVQGSCLLLRRSVIDTVGMLDESYFMYFEETDLCFRIKRSGHKIVIIPDATITHFGGGEEGHFTERRLLHYHRSLLLFFKKNRSAVSGVAVRFTLIVRSVIRLAAWILLYCFRPSIRGTAASVISGYRKTFGIIFTGT